MAIRYFYVWAALLCVSGCSSEPQQSLPRFEPPPAGAAAAEIIRHTDVATTAGHSFSGGDSFIATVDGAEVSSGASSVRVTPGVHRIGINCLFRAWVVVSTPQHTVVTGPFVAGQSYYAKCARENDKPRAWLAESPEGLALPQGFSSIS
jgi:hypothetical protein